MDVLTLSLIVIVCYGLYAYFKKRTNYFKELGIPNVPPHFPFGIIGRPYFRSKHITDTIRDMYNYNSEAKYVGTYDYLTPVIVLRDPELIKTVTIKNFDNFPDHRTTIDEVTDPLVGNNIFFLSGDRWRETRNLLTPAFTASKMKGMFELMDKCAENFANYVDKHIANNPGNEIITKDLFTKYTSDVIASCAFGISIDTLKNPDNDFYRLGREATKFDGIKSLKFLLILMAPWLAKFLGVTFMPHSITTFFEDLVAKTIAMRDEQGIRRPDMLQLMMDARGKTSENVKLDITEITAQAFIFFFGGFESTSTQMCIIAHELTINPDIQAKLQTEIDEVLSSCGSGGPTYEALNAMPYLDAVFNESVRRHTQNAILDRICRKSFELPPALPGGKPFVIPPGMGIFVPVTGIHHDPQYYENPDKFDPDRYLDTKVTSTTMNSTNLGFGIGPRSCIGNRFAILETKILFFHLLSKFTLKPTAKTCSSFECDPNSFPIMPKGGYYLSIDPRI